MVTFKKNSKKAMIYKKMGYKIILINNLKSKNDFYLFYKKIYKMGYGRMLIEAGLTFLNNLLKNKLINNLYIFKSANKLGKKGKNNTTSRFLRNILPKSLTINLDGDKLLKKEF